ncbi:hypothetical protein [Tessaracoccus sp. Y1736]
MGSSYVRKTDRRRYEDRKFSIRAAHRDPVDLHKLAEVLIRLTLQETGQTRAIRRNQEPPETYRVRPAGAHTDPIPVPVSEGQVE